MRVNLNGKTFRGVENYEEGDLNLQTVFRYHQKGNAVWGEIFGGEAVAGGLVALMKEDGRLDMAWHYVNYRGEVIAGIGESEPEILDDGRVRLHETWDITKGPTAGQKGTSVIEEIDSEPEPDNS